MTRASALGPPVEQAMITTRWPAGAGRRCDGRRSKTGRVAAAGRRRRREEAAASTLPLRSVAKAANGWPIAGLGTRSKAPSASASTARAPWAGEKADTTTTGTDVPRPARSALSTPRPSRPGMCRSSVIASGRCSLQAASASSPSAAVATTSNPWRTRASERMRRIRRESSATTTRCAVLRRLATGGAGLRGGEVVGAGAGEQTLRVEQDHQAVADLGDRLDRAGVGGRDGLELVGGHGQDLLDVADDHAGLAGAGLDDDDLAELGAGDIDADAGGQVVDRDDLAAQADDAANPRHVGGNRTWLCEADDLVHGPDREGVLLG